MDKGIFQDLMFYYGIAFVIFMTLAYKYGKKPMLGWLDSEIAKVRDELEQASKLRVEAEAVLATYKKKQAEAMAEAEQIVRQAQTEAQNIKAQAEAELKASLARHEQLASDRIRVAESEAAAAVRQAAVELAITLARQTLATKLDAAAGSKILDQAIGELPTNGGKNAKAA